MKRKQLVAACLLLAFANLAWTAETELGVCDTGRQRVKQTIQFNIESRNDTDVDFRAKQVCSDNVIKIKRCAVINVENKKIQHYCYPKGQPAYFEYVDVIEYWGAPADKGSAQGQR